MGHIKPNVLVDIITIYNLWRDPATGKVAYFRSFVGSVRLQDKVSTVNVASIGWTRVVTQEMLVDALNSGGYSLDANGGRIPLEYADPDAWAALTAEQKAGNWTMQEGDYVVSGECPVFIPPDTLSALTALKPRKIQSINTVRQKGGDVNHWEVSLV